eukprot:5708628-Pyramimonas_sp.AAC.1
MPGDNDNKVWACKATRQCGFKNNYPSRQECWACGRDRDDRPTEKTKDLESTPHPRRRSRRPSRTRDDPSHAGS